MILNTKLHTPLNRIKLIQRPLLIQSLNKGMEKKLTIVAAPAGYGKTTLLSEWVKESEVDVAWVSLDKGENDLARFWNYCVAAIHRANPKFGSSLHPLFSNVQLEGFEPIIIALLNELDSLAGQFVLVLDDYHVIEQPMVHSSLAFFLEHLPPQIHLFITSRSFLPLPTARLKAKGELQQILVDDLRFQLDEGVQFFQDCMDLSLSRKDVSKLVKMTEGWVSGLHLAGISMKKDKNHTAFFRKFNGEQRDISKYLLEEVFAHQSDKVQNFLLKTSILGRMNSSLCEAVTEQKDCQEQLEMLEQKSLFIVSLDDKQVWYRYHHLFSDFLQRKLRDKYPEVWSESHGRAASWLKSNGNIEEAMDHLLAGNHFSDAAQFIEKLNPSLTQLKRSVLFDWLTALPDDYIAGRPMLELFNMAVLMIMGKQKLVKSRLLAIKDKLVEDEWKPFAGIVSLICANVAFNQKEVELTSEYFEEFEKYMPGGSYLQMIGANTAQGTDNDNLLGYIDDLHLADSFMKRWIKAWESKTDYPFVGYFLVSYSDLMYEWNRLDEAEKFARQALERKDIQPFARIVIRAGLNLSQIQWEKGHIDQAFKCLDQVQEKINSPDKELFLEKIATQKAYYWLHQGEMNHVRSWLKTCGLKPTDDISLYRFPEYLIMSRALENSGQINEASYLLERMYQMACREGRLRGKIRVLIPQSLIYERQGNTKAAMRKLAEALSLAEPHGYVRTIVDEGERMAELLTNYLKMRQSKFLQELPTVSMQYIRKLFKALNIEGTPVNLDILTHQELKILKLIEKGLTNKQIASEIYVTPETVKTHIKNMYRKLETNSRIQAIQHGKELGLL